MSVDPIVQGLDLSRNYLDQLDRYIKNELEKSFVDKIPGVDPIIRAIEHLLSQAEGVIASVENEIKTQIEPLLKNAIPDAIAIVSGLVRSLDENIGRLVSNIATTEDVLGTAIATLRQHAPGLAEFLATNLASGLGAGILTALETVEHEAPDAINPLLDELLAVKSLPPFLRDALTHARARHAPIFAFLLPAIILAALLPALSALGVPVSTDIQQEAFANLPTREADAPSLIEALIRGQITEDRWKWGMRHNGFNDDVALFMLRNRQERLEPDAIARAFFRGNVDQAYFERELSDRGYDPERAINFLNSARLLLPEEAIRNAFLRGMVDAPAHDKLLEHWGYEAVDAARIRALYFYIPPVPDIIHMGIRNVFNPQIVERFDLLGDYPQAFEDAARQQGVSREWAQKYWEAHWIVPGRDEAFTMFQRTVDKPLDAHADKITLEDGTEVYNVIGRDTLNLLLREVDTPPFYRDKVTQVAYRTLTRIDIRRLHKVGLLTKSQVERAYLDLGNTPEHARLLAEFVVRLNTATTKNQAQSLVTGIQRRVIELYVADKLSLDQVKETLADLEFTDAEISVFVAEADLVHESQRIALVEAGIGKLYSTGRIDAKDATKRMMDAGVPVNAMSTLFEKWDLAIEYRDLPDHVHRHRELTKSEIVTALVDSLIDQPTAETMLEGLGYDKASADTEIHLALYKSDIAARRTIIDAIRASFVNGTIEQLDASNRLDALYVPADQRDAYLSEWSLARETRTERIPIATLRDMFKGEYVTEVEVLAHLRRHRFTDEDAALLVKFWNAQPPPKRLASVPTT